MTTPTPPIELTGSGERLTGDVGPLPPIAARPAVVRSARRSPTPHPWPRPVATGGHSRCTGRSPGWSHAWPARSYGRRPRPRWRRSSPPATRRGSRHRGRWSKRSVRGVGADPRRRRARHHRAGRHRRDRRHVGCRRGRRRHVRAGSGVRSCGPSTASRSVTSRRASTWRRWVAGWRAVAPVSTRRATGRSKTWSSASRWCSPTAP